MGPTWRLALLGLFALSTACTTYSPRPLDGRAVLEELQSTRLQAPADGVSPSDAVVFALTNNPALRASRKQNDIAERRIVSAKAWANPELHLELQDPLRFAAGLRFLPPFPGERTAKIDLAEAYKRQVLAEIEDQENRLAVDVRILHRRIVMLDQKLELLETALRTRRTLLTNLEERIARYAATEIDRSLAAMKVAEFENDKISTALDREQALADLAEKLGISASDIVALKPGPGASVPTGDAAALLERALVDRPDLRAIKEQYEEHEHALHLAHLQNVPWLRFLEPGVERLPHAPNATVKAGVTIPVFNQTRIAEAEVARDKARADYTAKVAAIRADIARARIRVDVEERRRTWFRAQVLSSVERIEKVVAAHLSALDVDIMKIVIIADRAIAARQTALETEFELERAVLELQYAVGTALAK